MKLFPYAHATHPQWRMAAGLVLAQLRAQMALRDFADSPSLALVYVTDHYAEQAQDIFDLLSAELPGVVDWAGTVGVGICANNAEYFDEPALAVMLCELPADQYRVFSGISPLGTPQGSGFKPHTALVHADATTPDLADLIGEMAQRTATGYLFGGLASSRGVAPQFAFSGSGTLSGHGAHRGVLHGGLSGVAFGAGAAIMSRVTQGCRPVARWHTITQAEGNVVLQLDGRDALAVLLEDLAVDLDHPREALSRVRATLVGLSDPADQLVDGAARAHDPSPDGHAPALAGRAGQFGSDVIVRHIIGLDPARQAVAVAQPVHAGLRLAFCERHAQAARADLQRICAEIREELEPQDLPLATAAALALPEAESAPHPARRIAGAVYVSCAGRGGPHFGAPSAELQIVRRALGDVPLVGFFAGGEIARHHLYGYTGVLTVFTA